MNGLGLGQENAFETASAFLSEDEAMTAQRTTLIQKKARIGDVMSKLYHFGL